GFCHSRGRRRIPAGLPGCRPCEVSGPHRELFRVGEERQLAAACPRLRTADPRLPARRVGSITQRLRATRAASAIGTRAVLAPRVCRVLVGWRATSGADGLLAGASDLAVESESVEDVPAGSHADPIRPASGISTDAAWEHSVMRVLYLTMNPNR